MAFIPQDLVPGPVPIVDGQHLALAGDSDGFEVTADKRDAMALAKVLSLGQVTEIRVPIEEQEALRDLSRARQAGAQELAKSWLRIRALLLRHDRRHVEFPQSSPGAETAA